ncbi:MAG: ribonuclease E/G, partial [Humibacter sp.]
DGARDAFDEFRITEQIEKALDRKVWLPSGGSLVIDRTEAMTVIDVNTGKFVGSGGNLEETVTKNNLEAAEEIVRQLRLRDIGGIIVVDFIDMVLESNRDLVLRRLVECLSRDRTKHQVAEVTSLGLVQMTRKKLGLGLLETFSEPCEVCAGRGVIVHHDPVTRHRAPQPPERRRGAKGGNAPAQPANGNGNGNGNGGAHTGTHAITDDAKNALAQIAASTLHTHHESTDAQADVPTAEASPVAAQPESSSSDQSQQAPKSDAPRTRRGSRGRGGSRRAAEQEPSDQTTVPVEQAQEAVAPVAANVSDDTTAGDREAGEQHVENVAVSILDIPLEAHSESKPKVDRVQAQELLGSVLDSLPEPKQPGQGRSRRRVTTAGLTGGVIPSQDDSRAG